MRNAHREQEGRQLDAAYGRAAVLAAAISSTAKRMLKMTTTARAWLTLYILKLDGRCQLRPYNRDNTGSCQITEVKLVLAELVLRWVTTLEPSVLQSFAFFGGRHG